jgi:hypothetical protein
MRATSTQTWLSCRRFLRKARWGRRLFFVPKGNLRLREDGGQEHCSWSRELPMVGSLAKIFSLRLDFSFCQAPLFADDPFELAKSYFPRPGSWDFRNLAKTIGGGDP